MTKIGFPGFSPTLPSEFFAKTVVCYLPHGEQRQYKDCSVCGGTLLFVLRCLEFQGCRR
uniref:Uncharacterized protein n=1 Tax=Arundo donax TaxID=35708 RepID=A0A0A9BRG5_ARUDO